MTGWTWDYVEDRVTIPRIRALEKSWEITPPMSRSLCYIARFIGMKNTKGKR